MLTRKATELLLLTREKILQWPSAAILAQDVPLLFSLVILVHNLHRVTAAVIAIRVIAEMTADVNSVSHNIIYIIEKRVLYFIKPRFFIFVKSLSKSIF